MLYTVLQEEEFGHDGEVDEDEEEEDEDEDEGGSNPCSSVLLC
jgi:hypothetical protein